MKIMVKIRKLQKKDIKAITQMMLEFSDSYPKDYVNSKNRGSIKWLLQYALVSKDKFDVGSFVLELNGKVIGHIAYYKDERSFEGLVYELRALVIDKNYQNKGFGTKLIKYLEKELKKLKARIIWLQTGKKSVYYKKLGYKLVAIYRNYWAKNKDRYVMARQLNP